MTHRSDQPNCNIVGILVKFWVNTVVATHDAVMTGAAAAAAAVVSVQGEQPCSGKMLVFGIRLVAVVGTSVAGASSELPAAAAVVVVVVVGK